MTIGNAFHRIWDWLVKIVPLNKHRIKTGDRTGWMSSPHAPESRGLMQIHSAGNPLVAGGSLAASPICRCAWHIRVNESSSSRTCFPSSRKYSAMVVATFAALTRSRWWIIARTDDHHAARHPRRVQGSYAETPAPPGLVHRSARSPKHPRLCIFRYAQKASVLFPTPGPEKIPMRCPSPQVCNPSIARMLVLMGWRMFARSIGKIAGESIRRVSLTFTGPFPSIGLTKTIQHPAPATARSNRSAGRR